MSNKSLACCLLTGICGACCIKWVSLCKNQGQTITEQTLLPKGVLKKTSPFGSQVHSTRLCFICFGRDNLLHSTQSCAQLVLARNKTDTKICIRETTLPLLRSTRALQKPLHVQQQTQLKTVPQVPQKTTHQISKTISDCR